MGSAPGPQQKTIGVNKGKSSRTPAPQQPYVSRGQEGGRREQEAKLGVVMRRWGGSVPPQRLLYLSLGQGRSLPCLPRFCSSWIAEELNRDSPIQLVDANRYRLGFTSRPGTLCFKSRQTFWSASVSTGSRKMRWPKQPELPQLVSPRMLEFLVGDLHWRR